MNGASEIRLIHFSLVYLLLIVVLLVMKRCKINRTRLLFWASLRMTVQLVLAGTILTYILKNPHWSFVLLYLGSMIAFAVHRVISVNPGLNRRFRFFILLSIAISALPLIGFFVTGVIGENFFNAQYTIPLSGMIIGNAMTGVTLGVKTFRESLAAQKPRINALLNLGVTPRKILLPFVNQSLQTAILPTMNSMLGMGIVALPGMMTGQILSGTLPTTAVLYQIAICIAICAVVCLSVFSSLYFGYRTLYNSRNQIEFCTHS